MPTELPEAGYEELRQHIDSSRTDPDQWDYIALFDDTGTEQLRVSITGDSRASWTHTGGDQTLTAEITITGGDADVTQGTTFAESKLFKVSGTGNGSALSSDTFTNATIDTASDELTVTHNVEVPQV